MTIKYVLVIVILLLFALFVIQNILFSTEKGRNKYITLKEVIPDAEIVSETEGMIRYSGMNIILGQSDFKRKKELIEALHLKDLSGYSEIDMHYRKQIVVRRGMKE